MDAVVMTRGSKKSPSATNAHVIQPEEQSRQETTTIQTPATVAVPAAGITLQVFVGDDRTAERAAWTGYRIGNSGVSGRAGGEERRWQYAMRITASVFGAPVALP